MYISLPLLIGNKLIIILIYYIHMVFFICFITCFLICYKYLEYTTQNTCLDFDDNQHLTISSLNFILLLYSYLR